MMAAYSKEPANGIPVTSWKGDKSDTQLLELLPVLELLTKVDDVRVYLKKICKGGLMNFKKALAILKQEIPGECEYRNRGTKYTADERNMAGRGYKSNNDTEENPYGLKNEEKYSLGNSMWKNKDVNMRKTLEKETTLKKYTAHDQLLKISTPVEYHLNGYKYSNRVIAKEIGNRQPIAIMNKELDNNTISEKHYNEITKSDKQSYGNRTRARAYGIYQLSKVTYANF